MPPTNDGTMRGVDPQPRRCSRDPHRLPRPTPPDEPHPRQREQTPQRNGHPHIFANSGENGPIEQLVRRGAMRSRQLTSLSDPLVRQRLHLGRRYLLNERPFRGCIVQRNLDQPLLINRPAGIDLGVPDHGQRREQPVRRHHGVPRPELAEHGPCDQHLERGGSPRHHPVAARTQPEGRGLVEPNHPGDEVAETVAIVPVRYREPPGLAIDRSAVHRPAHPVRHRGSTSVSAQLARNSRSGSVSRLGRPAVRSNGTILVCAVTAIGSSSFGPVRSS